MRRVVSSERDQEGAGETTQTELLVRHWCRPSLCVQYTQFCISSPWWSRRAVATSHIWHSERKTYCNTTRHDRTRHDTTLQRNPFALNVEDLSCEAFLDFAAATFAAYVDQVNFVIVVTPLSGDPPCLVRVCVSMSLVGCVHGSVAVSTYPSHFAPDPEGQVWSSATVSSGHKRVDLTSATNTFPRLLAKHCTEMLLPSQVRVGESVSNFCVSASPCLKPCAITLADAFFAYICGVRSQQKPKDIGPHGPVPFSLTTRHAVCNRDTNATPTINVEAKRSDVLPRFTSVTR